MRLRRFSPLFAMAVAAVAGAQVPVNNLAWNGAVTGWTGGPSVPVTSARDSLGNVIVGGVVSHSSQGFNWHISKWSPTGSKLWERTLNGSGNRDDILTAIAVDATNTIYVSGTTSDHDHTHVVVRRYSSSGSVLSTFESHDTGPYWKLIPEAGSVVGIAGNRADRIVGDTKTAEHLQPNLLGGYMDSTGSLVLVNVRMVGDTPKLTVSKVALGIGPVWSFQYNGPAPASQLDFRSAAMTPTDHLVVGGVLNGNRPFLIQVSPAGTLSWANNIGENSSVVDLQVNPADGSLYAAFTSDAGATRIRRWNAARTMIYTRLFQEGFSSPRMAASPDGQLFVRGLATSGENAFFLSPFGAITSTAVLPNQVPFWDYRPMFDNSGVSLIDNDLTLSHRYWVYRMEPKPFIRTMTTSSLPGVQGANTRFIANFNAPVPAGGVVIRWDDSWSGTSSFNTIAAGSMSAQYFAMNTQGTDQPRTITATIRGAGKTVTYDVRKAKLTRIFVDKSSVVAGNTVNVTFLRESGQDEKDIDLDFAIDGEWDVAPAFPEGAVRITRKFTPAGRTAAADMTIKARLESDQEWLSSNQSRVLPASVIGVSMLDASITPGEEIPVRVTWNGTPALQTTAVTTHTPAGSLAGGSSITDALTSRVQTLQFIPVHGDKDKAVTLTIAINGRNYPLKTTVRKS